MAWNEPGGGGNRQNPWGNNSGGSGGPKKDQGPPDLDEVVKNFTKKFSGKGGGFGGFGNAKAPGGGISTVFILAGLTLIWFLSGWYKVEPAERGLILRLGEYHDTVGPGPHWYPRFIDTVEIHDIGVVRNYPLTSTMLTQDENIVDIDLRVQYVIKDLKDYVLKIKDPDRTLGDITQSALREVIGQTKLDAILTEGRDVVAADTKTKMQELLDTYGAGLQVTQLNLQKADPPSAVKASFDDVIKAREDRERFKNEAQAYANTTVPLAEGQAKRKLEEAAAYKEQVVQQAEGEADRFVKLLTAYQKAPEVTRDRLYIETMESVFSRVNKVLVDVEGGNSLMYLPLDRMGVQPQAASALQNPNIETIGGSSLSQLPSRLEAQRNTTGSGRVAPRIPSRVGE